MCVCVVDTMLSVEVFESSNNRDLIEIRMRACSCSAGANKGNLPLTHTHRDTDTGQENLCVLLCWKKLLINKKVHRSWGHQEQYNHAEIRLCYTLSNFKMLALDLLFCTSFFFFFFVSIYSMLINGYVTYVNPAIRALKTAQAWLTSHFSSSLHLTSQ